MNNCSICENAIRTRRVFIANDGPLCRPRYRNEEYCAYCEWKGVSGPGKQLREIIKKVNNSF